ncbi:MAG: hypothetical protein A2445_05315 [Candidatus Jacksonbacteria bacterium RIFOXYC2_FULL_44_29]|nr:MAG: hypothetical protein UW45_C0030G0002 [Parcubacteria group bacterium GW2011_GWC2_44_22]OGY76181.1 MAG: hypothetical protein A2240_04815 [Candidatus Jacksonbacteria bacterium RIFOXYA2_FULL_43_12]OGY77899.1 MAG: hypothetical protein A2295_04485 [Candidatus Jacksonbacteria bacterium RIFOXYB2_FULL_44_15]OGY78719.1 MAG: hypothetical protein A2550_04355 [Candidatus Jacksonbacteria bacterium RIFOXYD2_FULL_43_21]OGY80269.1 MAG: hypothetical protein A2445_05315 [Candidatus Jacksonbacteria bacteri
MNFLFFLKPKKKKIPVKTTILWLIMPVILVLAIVIKFSLTQNERILIDYLPGDSDFWLWQNSDGFNQNAAVILRQLGVGDHLLGVFKKSADELLVYRRDGQWFNLAAPSWYDAQSVKSQAKLWEQLYQDGNNNLIGYLDAAYLRQEVPEMDSFGEWPDAYFIIKADNRTVEFTLIKKESVDNFVAGAQLPDFPGSGCQPLLALKLTDDAWFNKITTPVRDKLALEVAKAYPVIVWTMLPDQTWMQEKVIKPDLFAWQEINPGEFTISLDKAKANEYQVSDQLGEIKVPFGYSNDGEALLVTSSPETQPACRRQLAKASRSNFVYLNLLPGDGLVDVILGSSEVLLWLREQGASSLMVYEEGGVARGEVKF